LLDADPLSKTESIIVGVFLAGVCPLLTFVACWWTAAIVSMNVPGISEHTIALAALLGLTAGIVLDLLFLPMWIRRFYTAGWRWMWAFYAALFLLAGAIFMGVPVGTFGLGLLTGVYAGRRYHHAGSEAAAAGHDLRRVSFFTASLTAVTALPISILGLKEQTVVDLVRKIPGIEPSILQGVSGAGVVCLFCVVLFAALYGGSLAAGWWAYRLGTNA
jgi:hypothetical protein